MFCVLLYHFHMEIWKHTEGFREIPFFGDGFHQINAGHIGISLFFVLSGASLMISEAPFDLAAYAKKRIRTIYPAYYIVWAGFFLLTLLFFPAKLRGIKPWTIIFTVLGLDGLISEWIPNFYMAGEWFIGCLILLYVVYPLLRMGMARAPRLFLPVVLALWLIAVTVSQTWHFPIQADHMFYLRIPEFLIGMYLTRFLKRSRWYHGTAGLALAAVMTACFHSLGRFEILRYAGIGIGLFVFLRTVGEWLSVRIGGCFKKMIHGAASVSYEVFLLHHAPIIFLVRTFFAGRHLTLTAVAGLFLGWMILVMAGAWVLHRLCRRIFH